MALSILSKNIQEVLDFSNLIIIFNILHLKLYLIKLLNLLSTFNLLIGSSIALVLTLQLIKQLNAL